MSGLSIAEVVAYLKRGGLPVDYVEGENGCGTLCQLCPGSVMWTEPLQQFVCDRRECPGHEDPSLHTNAFHFKCDPEPGGFANVETQSTVVGVVEGGATVPPPTPWHPGTLHRCDVQRMLTTEPEPVDWLVEGVLARGYLTMLAGREKVGKSLASLAFAAAGVRGGEVGGIRCARARTLIVDAENGEREIHRRLRMLGLDKTAVDSVVVYETRGFDLARVLDDLAGVIRDVKPDIAWLDSWRSMWTGDENDPPVVAKCLDPLRELGREHNIGIGLLHHESKAGGYRGSTAIGACVENIVTISRAEGDPDRRRRRLHNVACRFEQEADDRWLRLEADRSRGLLLIDECEPFKPSAGDQRASMSDRLLAALNGQPTAWAAWARSADVDPKHGTARRARDELAERGLVEQLEDGWIRNPGTVA